MDALLQDVRIHPEPSWAAFRTEYETSSENGLRSARTKYMKTDLEPLSEADNKTSLEERMAGGQLKPTYYQAKPSRQDKKSSKQSQMVVSGHTPSSIVQSHCFQKQIGQEQMSSVPSQPFLCGP